MRSAPSHRAPTTWAPSVPTRCTTASTIPTTAPERSASLDNSFAPLYTTFGHPSTFPARVHQTPGPLFKSLIVFYSFTNTYVFILYNCSFYRVISVFIATCKEHFFLILLFKNSN